MKNILKRSTLVVAVSMLLSSQAIANPSTTIELIEYPGAENTQAWSINSKGEVVASSAVSFIYDRKSGGVTEIDTPVGYENLAVFATSESGDKVGSAIDVNTGRTVGVFIDKKGNVDTFEHPDSNGFTQARAMNSKGMISGFYFDQNSGESYGFLYDRKNTAFTTIVESAFTISQGINASGQTVGSAIFLENNPCDPASPFARYAWVRNPSGDVMYFNIEGFQSAARGIASNGTIVGFYFDNEGPKGFKIATPKTQCATITLEEGERVNIPDAIGTYPQYISDNGKNIVGQFITEDQNFVGFVIGK
ncbi:MAG: hypothetical protein CML20_02255 [Rheinheimera sp.]|uniref:hypothetical protein n=1 Tax=Arsukibacterium sp. UBA3155 TaxID=1946058 RepID=UPI000C8FA989|nr:hypothetical protein [Arsukibacterium sp. UBA3155]MAD73621.1 hypothetical protein [Rheinheimera sp.]|tara:strand:+ start:180781 stop:181698 length:918 start_codon:yes stop_codon:yes gene_type:complete